MPKLSIFVSSFCLLLLGFVFVFKDKTINEIGRYPASVLSNYNDKTFVDAVISSRKLNKVVRSFIETSNSLFFINSESYLCFELGKSEIAFDELRALDKEYSKVWPQGQSESIKAFIQKYPKNFNVVCDTKNNRDKKKFLMQLGQSAREVASNIFLDKHYQRNYRELYTALERQIDNGHQKVIYNEISQYLNSVRAIKSEELGKMKLAKTCYKLGQFVLPFYVLNTSYLDRSKKRNAKLVKEYARFGEKVSAIGPICHGKKSNIKRSLANVQDSVRDFKKIVK